MRRSRTLLVRFMLLAASIGALMPISALAGKDVFTDIATHPSYMEAIIIFKVKECPLHEDTKIEVLRAEKKSGDYKSVGLAEYNQKIDSYQFRDKTVRKTSYFYKLRVKGEDVTSDPFRGDALLVPPGT